MQYARDLSNVKNSDFWCEREALFFLNTRFLVQTWSIIILALRFVIVADRPNYETNLLVMPPRLILETIYNWCLPNGTEPETVIVLKPSFLAVQKPCRRGLKNAFGFFTAVNHGDHQMYTSFSNRVVHVHAATLPPSFSSQNRKRGSTV